MTQDHPRTWIARHYSSFDGLRAVAVLLVFINHYGQMVLPFEVAIAFWPGVDLFFALSGFLITGILYDSKQGPNFFRNFYIRRALRIFPLYYGVLIAVVLLLPVMHAFAEPIFWSNFFYISNLTRTHPQTANPTYVDFHHHPEWRLIFGHFWSLCVEEQFYLVWPLLIWILPSRRAMMSFALCAVVVSLTLRISLYLHDPQAVASTRFLYYVTYTRCDGLFIGAWLALWLREKKLTRAHLYRAASLMIVPSLLILAVGEATVGRRWRFNEVNPLLCTYGYTLVDLAAGGLLLITLDESNPLSRLFRVKPLMRLGTISYGFYLFHAIPIRFFELARKHYEYVRFSGSLVVLSALVSITALAWVSFRFYESPFLRLKDKLAPSHTSVPSGNAL